MDNVEKLGCISVILMVVGVFVSLPAITIIGASIGIGIFLRFIKEEL